MAPIVVAELAPETASMPETAASELPRALRPRRERTARQLELLKARRSRSTRIDAYFQLVNPEVLHADREKVRFEKMSAAQREAAALRAMSQQFTQAPASGHPSNGGGGDGAGRMGAASEQVLREFIQSMADKYEQNWNVGEYVKQSGVP